MPRLARTCVGRALRFAPSKRISPALAAGRPLIVLTTLLLPEPLGPSSATVYAGALAGPVGANPPHAFPGGNRERHAPDHLVVAIGDFEIADLKQHCRRSRGRRRRQRARFAPAPARRKRWVAPRAAPGCDRPRS